MLKIYGADLSSPANKVRFVAHALGLEYEYIRVSIKDGENRTEEFLRLHPAGKIPVIDDDGFILFESDAICRYLAIKHNSPLYLPDLRQRALIDQWMDFINIHVGGALGKVLFNRVFAPFAKAAVDERAITDGIFLLSKFLPVIDQQIQKKGYIAADKMTLADLALLATLDPAEVAQVTLSPYKNIVRWRDELRQKEFYTRCHKEYGERLKNMAAKA